MMITIHISPNHFCLSYRYPGLGIREIREFLDEQHPHVYNYLPEPDIELPKVPKEWFVNVCATVLQEKFTKWIKDGVDKRHDKVKVKKDIDIDVDPEIAERAAVLAYMKKQIAPAKVNAQRAATIKAQEKIEEAN